MRRTKELAGQWMDAPAMMRTKLRWNTKMRDGMRRCTMEHEDVQWNVKMHNETRRCTVKCEDAWWNVKMCSETWRCVMECEDAQWNVKMRNGMRRCARTWRCATMRTKHECGKVSWIHDGDVVLWSPVVMSCKICRYQPIENWVSTLICPMCACHKSKVIGMSTKVDTSGLGVVQGVSKKGTNSRSEA
jgi:hypothetical protein